MDRVATPATDGEGLRLVIAHAEAEAAARGAALTEDVMRRVFGRLPRWLRFSLTVEADSNFPHLLVFRDGRCLGTLEAAGGKLACPGGGVEPPGGVPPIGTPEFERGRARFRRAVGVLAAFRRYALRRPRGLPVRRSREARPRMRRAGRSTRATRAGPDDGEDGEGEPGGRCESAPAAGPSSCGRRPS